MHWHAALIISADLRSLPVESKAILLNTAAIAVDQDELGKMGRLVNTTGTRNHLQCRVLLRVQVEIMGLIIIS
eukprot:COSAG01_NODE_3412_length_6112_cov_2.531354_4_plen_73_part_00